MRGKMDELKKTKIMAPIKMHFRKQNLRIHHFAIENQGLRFKEYLSAFEV